MGDIVPREEVSKQGVRAVGGLVGGVGMFVLNGLSALPVAGPVIGGLLVLVGLAVARTPNDRRAGFVVAGAGAAALVAGLFGGGLGSWLLGISGVGLLGLGAYNLYQFVRNLRRRM